MKRIAEGYIDLLVKVMERFECGPERALEILKDLDKAGLGRRASEVAATRVANHA